VINFEKSLSEIFNQRSNLRDAVQRIDNFGRRRVQILRNLVQNTISKQFDAYSRLKQNYLDDLKFKTRLGEDKVFTQSANILRQKAENNVSQILQSESDIESGLQKLARLLDFKDLQDKNQGLKTLNKNVGDAYRIKKNALTNLEAIAQNILRSNLRTLSENNNLRKQLLMSNLFSNIERKQRIKLRRAFGNLIQNDSNPYAYAHFANFLG
jgi:hypothetical protein